MKLRCWPNCIARINFSEDPALIDRIVTVERYYGPTEANGGLPSWVVTAEWFRDVWWLSTGSTKVCADIWLTPITPPPGTDVADDWSDLFAEREDQLVGLV